MHLRRSTTLCRTGFGAAMLGVTALFGAMPTSAATFAIQKGEDGVDQISIRGEFEYGDDRKFLELALRSPAARVVLDSPGGNLDAGLLFARVIRRLKFTTVIPPEATCASACALAWLGGHERFTAANSRLGFHAAYSVKDGKAAESGVGNALIGAFLNEIGLSRDAIVYITSAPPEGMRWLELNDARLLGIAMAVTPRASTRVAATVPSPPPPVTAPVAARPPAPTGAPQASATVQASGQTSGNTPTSLAKPSAQPALVRPAITWRVRMNVSQGIQNVRAGPGTMHALVASIPAGTGGLITSDCRSPDSGGGAFPWCRVNWQGKQGWVSSNGLEVE